MGNYEDDELEAEENEFGHMDDESPHQIEPPPRYVPSALSNVTNVTSMPTKSAAAVSMAAMVGGVGSHAHSSPGLPMAAPSQLISAQQQMLSSQM